MYEVLETMNMRRVPIATAPTFEEAKAKVEAMGVAYMDDDADYPGCADAYTNDGRVLAIQPVGFTIKAADEAAKAKAHARTMNDAAAAFDAEFGIMHAGAPYHDQAYMDHLHDRAIDDAFENIGD